MVQRLRTPVVLVEKLSPVSWVAYKNPYLQVWGHSTLFGLLWAPGTNAIHIHAGRKFKNTQKAQTMKQDMQNTHLI